MGARQRQGELHSPSDTFVPLVVQDFEVADESTPLPGSREGRAHLLVRHHGWPLCQTRVSGLPLAACRADWIDALRRAAPEALARSPLADCPALSSEQGAAGGFETSGLPQLSVVVPTLGVSPQLRQVVISLLNQDHEVVDVFVVDNAPTSYGVAPRLAGIDDPRLHILSEPRRGASRARNAGLAETRTALVAFVDDDALPDLDWARRITQVFACDPSIQCVTGLVVPHALETIEQIWFEEFNGFEKGYHLAVWTSGKDDAELRSRLSAVAVAAGSPGPAVTGRRGAAFPYTAAEFGSGNSMAFRASALRETGGFDPALGPGTPARAGEDLDVFRAIYLAGGTIVYQPAAVVRHHHRRGYDQLRQQIHSYGVGLTAHVTKLALTQPHLLPNLLARAPASVRVLLSPSSEKNAGKSASFPADLTNSELRGIAWGPWAYLRSRRAALTAKVPSNEEP